MTGLAIPCQHLYAADTTTASIMPILSTRVAHKLIWRNLLDGSEEAILASFRQFVQVFMIFDDNDLGSVLGVCTILIIVVIVYFL